jgi:hypothetical protein
MSTKPNIGTLLRSRTDPACSGRVFAMLDSKGQVTTDPNLAVHYMTKPLNGGISIFFESGTFKQVPE